MIHIDRNRNDEAGTPIRPPQEWFDDAEDAREIAIREMGNHDPDDNIYGNNIVRAALEKLFYDKCAYCESEVSGVLDWNVEHFRPKGRVAERDDHPGYYWLAYDWENLYPSCTFCNQRRKDKPRWGDPTYAESRGKMDQFPLEDETMRTMSHNDIKQETPLLIDPCIDNPEEYLGYDIHGQVFALDDSLRGQATIDICHLRQRRLRDRRIKMINAVVDFMQMIRDLEARGDNIDADKLRDLVRLHFLNDSCEFAGASRAVINDPDAFGI